MRFLYCSNCSYKKFIQTQEDMNGLVLHKRSPIMKTCPYLGDDNKTVKATFGNLPKKYKCPKCGNLASIKKTADHQEEKEQEEEQE